jgi:hypothetical protein
MLRPDDPCGNVTGVGLLYAECNFDTIYRTTSGKKDR